MSNEKIKPWGVLDITGFFGPEPFLASTEAEARGMADGDPFSIIVRRDSASASWQVVP